MASEPAPDGASARGGVARDRPSRAARAASWEGVDTWALMTAKFLAGVGFWGGFGYLLDAWLGTSPIFFTIGTLLGLGAALYLMWLTTDAGKAHIESRAARTGADAPEGVDQR